MNYDRMLALADTLESEASPVGFNMVDWVCLPGVEMSMIPMPAYVGARLPCGTTCCIAGHACLMFSARGAIVGSEEATVILGLTDDQADRLFFDEENYISRGGSAKALSDITRAEAVAAIRRMVAEDKLEHGVAAVEAEELVYA